MEIFTIYLFSGKNPDDEVHLSALSIKPGFKIMMMGSLEEEIEAVSLPPEDLPDVVNDFDIPEGEEVAICNREVIIMLLTFGLYLVPFIPVSKFL